MQSIICIKAQKGEKNHMHYTQRLKDIREDKDLNQENIADVLNITRQQYQLYESGKREIKVHQIIKLCKFYNISPEYILGFTNIPKPLPKK